MALEVARASGEIEVTALLCTVNADADRVAMHAVRRDLLQAQADRLGLPLVTVEIPQACSDELYGSKMADAIAVASGEGVRHVVFGDLFLADVRAYRERALAGSGITPLFPLWGRNTAEMAREMIAGGLRAVVTCVDARRLGARFVGREFDSEWLASLPATVDPCGENGEFHTFVWHGPGFSEPIPVETGEIVSRDGFLFCDVKQRA